jgi:hypothetical protein
MYYTHYIHRSLYHYTHRSLYLLYPQFIIPLYPPCIISIISTMHYTHYYIHRSLYPLYPPFIIPIILTVRVHYTYYTHRSFYHDIHHALLYPLYSPFIIPIIPTVHYTYYTHRSLYQYIHHALYNYDHRSLYPPYIIPIIPTFHYVAPYYFDVIISIRSAMLVKITQCMSQLMYNIAMFTRYFTSHRSHWDRLLPSDFTNVGWTAKVRQHNNNGS